MLGFMPDDVGLLVAASDPRLSPDGARVVFSVQRIDLAQNRYHSRLWIAPLDGSTPPAAISPENVSAGLARWSPDGIQLAYSAHALDDDDAASEICVVPAVGDAERRVVYTCRDEPHELEWSPDGKQLAFVARDPDAQRYGSPGSRPKDKDVPPRRIERLFTRLDNVGWIADRPSRVFVVAADGSAPPRSLTPGPFEAGGVSWSPDGRAIAIASARHDTWDIDWAVDLFVADVVDRDSDEPSTALRRLTNTGPEYMYPTFGADASRVACYRTPSQLEGPWNSQVAIVPVAGEAAGGDAVLLTESLDRTCAPYPVPRGPVWRGNHVYFMAEERGYVHVYRVASDGSAPPEVVIGGARVVNSFDVAADGAITFVATSPTSLPECYSLVAGEERQLTNFTAELNAHDRVIAGAERFSARSTDDVEVDCFVIEPQHEPGTPVPLVLNIHGGPFTQYEHRVFDEFQFQVGAGFGVLFCNPRGSSGFTEAWGRSIRWPECKVDSGSGWGGVDYDDIMACVDEAVRRFDWIDPARIAVMGGSYGGYMTSWIIGHNDRFAAAISERACNNLITLEHGSDVAGVFASYVGVRHFDDPGAYLRQSPITYVREMQTPLLILHSENDLRCPINQAEELFVALRLLGRTPEFVRFPGESHELSRSGAPRHRVQRAEIVVDFLRRHL
jgi:dipeptidyl aminopeptidase/acylaminoacyl peptidase